MAFGPTLGMFVLLYSYVCLETCSLSNNSYFYNQVNVLLLNNIGLSVAGVLITLCPLLRSYELLVLFAVFFGLAACKLV